MTAGENHPLLEVRGLSVSFGSRDRQVDAVTDVSFHVYPGETLAILGESGSGKSVSAMTIMGLVNSPPARISPDAVYFHGENLGRLAAEKRRQINGHRLAMIFQDPLAHLNPVYTVGWQIAEVFREHAEAGEGGAVSLRVVELLRRVGIPSPESSVHKYPHEFSGGQRQRIMIAMALALRPEVLIADEATTALDVTVQAEILALIKSLQVETGMALIVITHDLGVAAQISDRTVVINRGEVAEHGETAAVFANPRHPYTKMLLSARPAHDTRPPAPIENAEPVVEVRDLHKRYFLSSGLFGKQASLDAVRDVSFDIGRGETLALVGESGSGKSSVARMLLRIDRPTAGKISYRGNDISTLRGNALRAYRRKVQMVFQDPYSSLNPSMRVIDILKEPLEIHGDVVPLQRRNDRVHELIEQVGLRPEHLQRYPHEFSGGQRQRIAIARALTLEPEVIVCDEAVSALDVSVQAQVLELLIALQRRLGVAYLFISHDLDVVRQIAHRIVVMKAGTIVEAGLTGAVFDRPQHKYTRTLLSASTGLAPPASSPDDGLSADVIPATNPS